jgi:hypothetical protein
MEVTEVMAKISSITTSITAEHLILMKCLSGEAFADMEMTAEEAESVAAGLLNLAQDLRVRRERFRLRAESLAHFATGTTEVSATIPHESLTDFAQAATAATAATPPT